MAFTIRLMEFDANGELVPVETHELKNFKPWESEGITEEEYFEREASLFCDCEEESEYTEYVDGTTIPGIGYVDKHGYICPKCGRYVQIG